MNPEIGMRVRNVQPNGKPGHTFREVVAVGPDWVGVRLKGDRPYLLSRKDFERHWREA